MTEKENTIQIYKSSRKHQVEEAYGRKYICGPRTSNHWFLIVGETSDRKSYEVKVATI